MNTNSDELCEIRGFAFRNVKISNRMLKKKYQNMISLVKLIFEDHINLGNVREVRVTEPVEYSHMLRL